MKKIIFIILVYFIFLTNSYAVIKDSIFATIGDKAITRSDIENEVKIILILTETSFSEERRQQLETAAIQATIQRNIKKAEIEKYNLTYNEDELNEQLIRLANNINVDLDTLKNIFITNGIDFSIIVDQIKTELLWNSFIFEFYKNRLSVNLEEIDDEIKKIEKKKVINEFLLSELIIGLVEVGKLEATIEEVKSKINDEGFDKAALEMSIAESAIRGGDLGWINENQITQEFKSKIINTSIGNISEPIFLPEGILFFQLRDKRTVETFLNIDDAKEQLIKAEKNKILKMHSLTHYENLKRITPVIFH